MTKLLINSEAFGKFLRFSGQNSGQRPGRGSGEVRACLLSCLTGILPAGGGHASPSPGARETPGCGHSAGRGEAGSWNRSPRCPLSWLWWSLVFPAFPALLPARPASGPSSCPSQPSLTSSLAPGVGSGPDRGQLGRPGAPQHWSPWGTINLLAPCSHPCRSSSCLLGSPTRRRGLPTQWGW